MKRGVGLVCLGLVVGSLVFVQSHDANTEEFIPILGDPLSYHHGPLFKGNVKVQIIWYGKFSITQRSIILDFLQSLNYIPHSRTPSPFSWWRTLGRYRGIGPNAPYVKIVNQIFDNYSLGKSLKTAQINDLALRAQIKVAVNFVNVVLTSADVAVEGFCSLGCGTHGSVGNVTRNIAFAFVGNAQTQCPGNCTWPFNHPFKIPKPSLLLPPNGDAGMDGMIIYLAALLAEVVTNPFGTGYYRSTPFQIVEASSACRGVFGQGAYGNYPGTVLKDNRTGGSYNAVGVHGRKFLLQAIWDPITFLCRPLV